MVGERTDEYSQFLIENTTVSFSFEHAIFLSFLRTLADRVMSSSYPNPYLPAAVALVKHFFFFISLHIFSTCPDKLVLPQKFGIFLLKKQKINLRIVYLYSVIFLWCSIVYTFFVSNLYFFQSCLFHQSSWDFLAAHVIQ